MESLRQALQAGTASGYERARAKAPELTSCNPFKYWLVRLLGKDDPEVTYTAQSVRENLIQNYGERIGEKVVPKGVNRPLTVYKIVKLDDQAARMQNSIEQQNRQHAKEWGNMERADSMASKLFTRVHGFSSSMLPDYEKARLMQHIEQSIFRHGDHKLSRGEAQALMLDVFRKHSPGFAEIAPKTARILGCGLGGEQLYPDVFAKWQDRQPLCVSTRNLLHAFRAYSSHSARLQWRSPFEDMDKRGWPEQIRATKTHIKRLRTAARHLLSITDIPPRVQLAMIMDLRKQAAAARSHVRYLQALHNCDFRSPANMTRVRMHNLETTLQIIEKTLADGDFSDEKRKDMLVLRNEVEQEINDLQDDPAERVVFMKTMVNVHAKNLRARLVKAGLSAKAIKSAWVDTSKNVSNATKWRPIEKVLPVRTEQGVKLYKGTITPASRMRLAVPGQPVGGRDPFTISYDGTGRSSATRREADHAVNLGQTALSTDDGRVHYRGLRSGTLSPPPMTPHAERIVENRARELLQAAIVERIGLLPADQQQRILSGEEPISFDMISTSMLSPDMLRHKTGIHDDEYRMQNMQAQTLVRLCREPLSIGVVSSSGKTHTVIADIRIVLLNIPVNNLGLNSLLSVPGRIWQTSDRENDEGFTKLFGNTHPDSELGGMVGDWLQREGWNSPNYDNVLQLVQQIRTIYSRQDHHTEGMDAYKLVERVQLLAFMIGAVPHFSCKSGKDRTGEADARIRQLASEVDRLGYVPDYNAPLTRDHQEAVQTFMFGAGNMEVQMQNINVPAFKTTTGREEMGSSLYKVLH